MSETIKSHVDGRIFKFTHHNGKGEVVVQILISCPICGDQEIQLAGHHLQSIRDLLVQAIELHPDETIGAAKQLITDSYTMKGRVGDPSTN